jgi:hypothetical protein
MAGLPIGFAGSNGAAAVRGGGRRLAPATLRMLLAGAAMAAALLAWFMTRGDAAIQDAELIRVLQFMTLDKIMIGFGALWLVSIRFRYAIAPHLAFAYIAAGAVMAAGPGAMWTTAHIILGSLLFYAGLAALAVLGSIDGGAGLRLLRRRA